MAGTIAQQASRTGTFDLPCSADEAFLFFSPEGERAWARGWNPQPVFPSEIRFEQGTVFRTRSGLSSQQAKTGLPPQRSRAGDPGLPPQHSRAGDPGLPPQHSRAGDPGLAGGRGAQNDDDNDTVWIILEADLVSHRAEYVRWQPRSHVARIVVQVEPLTLAGSRVSVIYTVTAFGSDASAVLAEFSAEAYAGKMRHWREWIQACLPSSLP